MGGERRKSEKQGRPNDDCNVNMALRNMDSEEKGTMFFRDPMEHLIELLSFNFFKKKVCWNVRNKFYRNSKLKTLSSIALCSSILGTQ